MTDNIEECLKKFIFHVDNLGKEDEPGGDGFWREFKELREIQIANKSENKYPSEEGKKECNIKKNRYKDILPYDYHRVVLSKQDGAEGSDYINASFIKDVNGKNGYIASQGPLPHTVNDFWRMLWEYKVEIVFMVCREEESGRPKCERYWDTEGEAKMFGQLEVTVESEKVLFPDFVERILRVNCGGEKHVVKQFHYTGWPDHGVPHHSREIYKMVGKMREARRLLEIPIVIHCSAGCGRTGTICAVDYAWTMLDQNKVSHGFSLYEVIKHIRQQRQSMVQTPDQYEFAHLVVQSLCEDWINLFQEHDYCNTDLLAPAPDDDEKTSKLQHSTPSPPSTPSTPTHTEGPRRPHPLPRPTLEARDGGDKYENVVIRAPSVKGPKKPLRAVSDSGQAYENQKPSGVSKTTSAPLPLKQTSPMTLNKQPRSQAPVAPTAGPSSSGNTTLPRAGHSTIIDTGTKIATKKTFAPPPPKNQVNAHKAGVLNFGQVGGQTPVPVTSTKKPGEVTNGQSDMYGEVLKNPTTGKLGSYPDVSRTGLEQGKKKRGGAVKKAMHKAEPVQNYENFPVPGSHKDAYENFPPLITQEHATTGPESPTYDFAPELPSRGYEKEEAITTLSPPPASGFGTVSALGGAVPSARSRLDSSGAAAAASASSRTIETTSSSSPMTRSVASSMDSVYSEISNVQESPRRTEGPSVSRAPPGNHQQLQFQNHNSAGTNSRNPFGVMKDIFHIRNQRPAVQVVQGIPGVYRFRGQDVGFDHRPQKPKGKKEEPRYWKTYM
ncbi:tyrosine-protein phosphatase non-receptor type 12-like isoform X2 [Haliotis rufescens]|uniref:tyrosine-protein phosphatase non-receptor type 12-like isoform X2 n=1 Tax=Haliotis rufescens TaxID=6454 RepID=UPI00201F82BE|nr:tyrosine-protein phosphatase non-receptor type 12-like isoform X2 [Haliotis rufescens]